MSRDISQSSKTALFNSRTSECFIILITIDHDDFVSPIRVNSSGETITSNGETYYFFPFDISLPAESLDEIPKIKIAIQDPTREITPYIRNLTTSPTISLSVVTNTDKDTIETGPYEMTLIEVSYDILGIEGVLYYEDIFEEPYPGDSFTPNEYPGLF